MSDAPQISSVTVGGFTLAGFLSTATFLGAYGTALFVPTDATPAGPLTGQQYMDQVYGSQASDWFSLGQNTISFIYQTPTADPANPYSFAQILTGTGSATDHWGLSVTCFGFTGDTVPDYIFNGAAVVGSPLSAGTAAAVSAGIVSSDSFIVGGFGANLLVNALTSLKVIIGGLSNFAIDFQLSDDTTGAVTNWTEFFNACFTAGTGIATPGGETAVEALRIGDRVVTADGAAKPVRWIGRRAYTPAQIAANPQLRPVLVYRGALGAGVPHRDLLVSPMHGICIDGVMVPAVSLVNGATILRRDAFAPVSYFHLELADHDVVFANGAPAETFIDDNSRLLFENADEFYDLYGADRQADSTMTRLDEGYQLDAIRRRLAARAGAIPSVAATGALEGHVEGFEGGVLRGWTVANGNTAPVELEVVADGEIVARVIANRYRLDLDHAGIAGGIGGFNAALPASVTRLAQVSVRRVSDGAELAQPRIAARIA